MSFIEYFKDKVIFIIINIIVLVITSYLLFGLNVSSYAIFIICILNFLASISFFIYDCLRKSKYYSSLLKRLDELDKKYFIGDVATEEDFLEGKILFEIISQATKSMKDDISESIRNSNDYKEYIELWVHEIKTPIASAKLILENDNSNLSERINYEMKRVEGFIEQVLYYARSSDVSKDYIIKEFSLRSVVMKSVKSNSRDFINKNIKLDIRGIEGNIFSDEKWVEFIINQIIINAVKFSIPNEGKVSIYSKVNENNIILTIEDNGVGINEKDIDRVFEKGFTGENGRKFGKSTGIGLYLCKKLCDKLGIGISLNSKENIGTKVNIVFPQGKFTDF